MSKVMQRLLKLFPLIAVVLFLAACTSTGSQALPPPPSAPAPDPNEDLSRLEDNKMIIYQVMTRLFGNTNDSNVIHGTLEQNGVGTFNDFTEEALGEVREMGFTHIWYTGVIEHATMSDWSEYGIERDDADVIKGIAGSPYAIKDYYDVNPMLAEDVDNRINEFRALVQRTHDAGLKVIIDLVGNHVARDYGSDILPLLDRGVSNLGAEDDPTLPFHRDNNFYYLPSGDFEVPAGHDPMGPDRTHPLEDGMFAESPAKATGNDVFSPQPSINDWFETIKLNYGRNFSGGPDASFDPPPSTWVKMLDIMRYWLEMGVDGFRVDMAEMVPVEFWQWSIPQVKADFPDSTFIAEIYNVSQYRPYISRGNFDVLYDKVGLYDALVPLIKGGGSLVRLQQALRDAEGIRPNMLYFLENHDEMRIASSGFAGEPRAALPAMLMSATISSGPVMVYFGQELGVAADGPEGFGGDDNRTTIFDYWGVPEFQAWVNGGAFDGGALSEAQLQLRSDYRDILQLAGTSHAVRNGSYYELHFANKANQSDGYAQRRMFSYARISDQEALLFIVNFDDQVQDFVFKVPETALELAGLEAQQQIQLTERGSGSVQTVSAQTLTNRSDPALGARYTMQPMSALVISMEAGE